VGTRLHVRQQIEDEGLQRVVVRRRAQRIGDGEVQEGERRAAALRQHRRVDDGLRIGEVVAGGDDVGGAVRAALVSERVARTWELVLQADEGGDAGAQ